MREGRELVAAFDAIMDAPPSARGPRVERLRTSTPSDPEARRARELCIRLFDSIAAAASMQERLEPMARELDAYVDAGRPVPDDRRDAVLRLYADAQRATEAASQALAPCTHAVDALRAHRARRR